MKINAITILLLLFLTSCVADHRSAQVRAVEHLAKLNYAVETLGHNPNVVIMDSMKELNDKWFSLTGLEKDIMGFYSYPDMTIYIRKNSSFNTVKHEYLHYYLDQLKVPIDDHHSIINN